MDLVRLRFLPDRAGRPLFRVAARHRRHPVHQRFHAVGRFGAGSFEMRRTLARLGEVITLQIEVGSAVSWPELSLVSIPVADAEPTFGPMAPGQIRGRTLPMPAAEFVERLGRRRDQTRDLPRAA